MHRQRARAGADHRDRRERLLRIEAHLRFVYGGVVGKGHRGDQQRVPVRLRIRRNFRADDAAGAAAVVDHHLLAEQRAHVVGHQAADDIVAAARRERHDDAHRFGGIGFGGKGAHRQRQQRGHQAAHG